MSCKVKVSDEILKLKSDIDEQNEILNNLIKTLDKLLSESIIECPHCGDLKRCFNHTLYKILEYTPPEHHGMSSWDLKRYELSCIHCGKSFVFDNWSILSKHNFNSIEEVRENG